MTTVFLVFVMIFITCIVFCYGVQVGSISATKRTLEYVEKALDESGLPITTKIHFMNKLKEAANQDKSK